jgi:hypothetical protein
MTEAKKREKFTSSADKTVSDSAAATAGVLSFLYTSLHNKFHVVEFILLFCCWFTHTYPHCDTLFSNILDSKCFSLRLKIGSLVSYGLHVVSGFCFCFLGNLKNTFKTDSS